jgi:predicted CXXCH cytochrome family protein
MHAISKGGDLSEDSFGRSRTGTGKPAKSLCAATLLLSFLGFCGLAAHAGVDDTHHDMSWLTGRQGADDPNSCSYCHVPRQVSKKAGIFERVGVYGGELDSLGAFCYNCHDGTVFPTALVEAPGGFIGVNALTNSHGYDLTRMPLATGNLEGMPNIALSGLVEPDPLTGKYPDRFSCNACHDVHSNSNPPFLRVPLGDICQRCHSGSDGLGKGRWTRPELTGLDNGPHPIGMAVKDGGLDRVMGLGAEKSFHSPFRYFQIPTPSEDDLRYIDTHWDTGGHLIGADKFVSCTTCHSVHLPAEDLLVALVAEDSNRETCSGCHTDGVNFSNPGVTPYYHPVNDESLPPYIHDHSTHAEASHANIPDSGFMELFVNIPKEFELGPQKELLCISCHKAHSTVPGKRCLRGGKEEKQVQCNYCHGTGDDLSAFNRHHPVREFDVSQLGFPAFTGWGTGDGQPGDLTDGLQCVDCHSEWAKDAHNW